MASFDDLLRRIQRDPAFRAAVETDPARSLDGYDLTDDELARLDTVLRTPTASVERFFAQPGRAAGAARPRWGWFVALAAGGLAVGGLAGAAGWVADPTPPAAALPADAFPLYACPIAADATPATVGEVRRGDRLWAVGRGPEGWIAVRDPGDLSALAWVRLAHADVDGAAGLPEVACDAPADVTVAVEPAPTTVAPTTVAAPVEETTTTSAAPAPTTVAATAPGTTMATTPAPTTVPVTTPGPEPSTPATTRPAEPDRRPPTLSLTPVDGTLVYTDNNLGCVPTRRQVRVVVSDDRPGATVDEVVFAFPGRSGTIRRGPLQPVGGDRWEVGPFSVDVPVDFPVALTVTARARDAAGNTAEATLELTLRPSGMDCIG